MAALNTGALLQQLWDWARKLAADPKNSNLLDSVVAFLKGLQRSDITAAIADIQAKQAALVGTGSLADLSTPNLILYATLGDAAVMLTATDLAGAAAADVQSWFVEHAIPVLEDLARLALPLLVML